MNILLSQPLSYHRVVNPRVHSDDAHVRTVRSRSRTMSEIRQSIAGSSTAANEVQLTAEFNRESRLSLLHSAGVTVDAAEGLSLKSSLSLPWNKLRHIRR